MREQPETTPLPEDLSLDLTAAEARELWSFLDGSIMDPGVRAHLRRAWGLCAQHNWSYAILEIEQRGGSAFSTGILFEDLTARAARAITRAPIFPWSVVIGRLKAKAHCFTCAYAANAERTWDEDRERAARTNRRHRVRPLVAASRSRWRQRSCPLCLGGQGPVCRPHLLIGDEPVDREMLGSQVKDIGARLERYVRSLTAGGRPATPDEEASWIEALSWFGGWAAAELLAGEFALANRLG